MPSMTAGVRLLRWSSLESTGQFIAVFTTREGGVSALPTGGLNLAFHVGDDAELVLQNRVRVARALGVELDALVLGAQVHGNSVALVTPVQAGAGARTPATAVASVDGLVSNAPGLVLAGCFADCVPVYIVDPVRVAVGLAHAGWRGTAGRVALCTLGALRRHFGSRPADCLAVIGPGIGACCYRVGAEVRDAFLGGGCDWERVATRVPGGGWQLDLATANRRQLEVAGVSRVTVAGMCTACDPRFFSYRRDGAGAGRMMALVGIACGQGISLKPAN